MTWEHSANALERENRKLYARIERLRTLLKECADDIAQTNHDQHPYRDEYPDQMRRYKRDMDIVYRARAELAKDIDDE